MVKIPELAEDGQNWKIYCAKFLKVAATFDCLEVLAGRPYEGEDWDGCNALLCCTFMESVPPSIYFKIHRRTAHENFKYLTKRFRDNEPIPRANEFQCAGTAAVAEMPENYPMSDNTATERHAHAKSDKEDLTTTTKDLTQGTQDVNDGNVGRTQDQHMSFEDSAKGISTECTEMTSVILKSAPHETQNQLETSLPLTSRLPTDGEPSRCKQEVAESVVTAERANGTVEMAEPTEMVADVNRTALLGGEPAETACEVNEGDGTECKDLQLLKAGLYCEERHQRNENTTDDIPIAYGLPLEGEWSVYSSDESDTLVIASIEPESTDSGEILHVCLGGTCWRVCDVEGLGDRADGSSCKTDGARCQTDALRASNRPEMAVLSHSEGVGTYLGARGVKHDPDKPDGCGNLADMSSMHTDAHSDGDKSETSANVRINVRMG